MRSATLLLMGALGLLSACASPQLVAPQVDDLFHDALFSRPSEPIHAQDALVVSAPMKEYAQTTLWHQTGHVDRKDPRSALVDAMYKKGELQLDYDTTVTRTAAEAFDAKSGNCLSLVLLTAALAKELGIPVRYQSVIGVSDWNQADQLLVTIGHVNLELNEPSYDLQSKTRFPAPLIVDFLPSKQASVLRSTVIEEKTVLAMFLNNRSVEAYIDGKINDAYWRAKEAMQEDPAFSNTYITLGIIYSKIHHPELADRVLNRLAQFDPYNVSMLTNHIVVLKEMGREAEANKLKERLDSLDPHPPMSYYFLAQSELKAGHFETAKRLIEKEISRDPDHHEYEFGLALVYYNLNNREQAKKHLIRAIELTRAGQKHELYRAKLEWLKSMGVH